MVLAGDAREGDGWGVGNLVPRGTRWHGSGRQSVLVGALSRGFLGQVSATGWELISR